MVFISTLLYGILISSALFPTKAITAKIINSICRYFCCAGVNVLVVDASASFCERVRKIDLRGVTNEASDILFSSLSSFYYYFVLVPEFEQYRAVAGRSEGAKVKE